MKTQISNQIKQLSQSGLRRSEKNKNSRGRLGALLTLFAGGVYWPYSVIGKLN